MRHIEFGQAKTKISEVILGTMRVWDKTADQVAETLRAARDAGINAVDTAPIYGPSEGLIGEAFAANPGLRDQFWLQTKVGIERHPRLEANYFDLSYTNIVRSVERSLSLLHTDHLDSLLLHRPDALTEPEEVARAFDELHAAGKVLDFGVSNQNPAQMRRLERCLTLPLTANQVQLSCAFTPMIDAAFNTNMENDAAVMRDGGILEYCAGHGVVVQAWSVLQQGYFGGVFLGSPEHEALTAALTRIAEEHNCTPAAAAINWILRWPTQMQAVIGTTNPAHIHEAAAACDWEMTREEWYEIYLAEHKLP